MFSMREFSFFEQKKFIEILFYIGISANLIGFLIMFYSNRSQYEPFFNRGLDGFLFLYLTVIVISAFTVYRLIKYYYEFQSFEYLLIAFIMYHFGFSFFLYQTYVDYIADNLIDSRDKSEMNSLGGYYYFLSQLLVVWHAIRIRGWKNSQRITRVFMVFLVYINSVIIMLGLEGELSSTPNDQWNFFIWKFEIFHRFSNHELMYLTAPTVLTYLFVILTYLQIKVYARNKVTTITKVMWIIFGIVIIIQRVISDYVNEFGIDQENVFRIWAVGTFLIMVVIQITLVLFPESLLITKNQILQAHNLYKIANRSGKGSFDSKVYSAFDYHARVSSYLDSLPPEMLKPCEQY